MHALGLAIGLLLGGLAVAFAALWIGWREAFASILSKTKGKKQDGRTQDQP